MQFSLQVKFAHFTVKGKERKYRKMKLLLFRLLLSVDSKLYMSCDNSHCTVHRCDKSQEGSGQGQEDIQSILGKLARFRL